MKSKSKNIAKFNLESFSEASLLVAPILIKFNWLTKSLLFLLDKLLKLFQAKPTP
jgi:hypothetical protein